MLADWPQRRKDAKSKPLPKLACAKKLQDHDDPFPAARNEPESAPVAANVPAVPRWKITGGGPRDLSGHTALAFRSA